MAVFIVRVELHEAAWADYETLHEAMGAERFGRTIRDDDGVEHQLPPAEYCLRETIPRATVLVKAKHAAARTGKRYSVLVTEAIGATWHNLNQA